MAKMKIKRFFKRTLVSFLAAGMLASYLPSAAFAAEIDEIAPVANEEAAPEVVEEVPAAAEEVPVVVEEVPAAEEVPVVVEEVPAEEEIPAAVEEVPEEVTEIADSEEEIPEEVQTPVEEAVEETVEEAEAVEVLETATVFLALSKAPELDPSTPPSGEDLYPEDVNMQELYSRYGYEFSQAADNMINDPSKENFIALAATMNGEPVNILDVDIPKDENGNDIPNVIAIESKDAEGNSVVRFVGYSVDPETGKITCLEFAEKSLESISDEKTSDEARIAEIQALYGDENTSVEWYYKTEIDSITQPKKVKDIFCSNQNHSGKFEPDTYTDDEGNVVPVYNYTFTMFGETHSIEDGGLWWDTTQKQHYGKKEYGCWMFKDKKGKVWNLTNMSTSSTSSHNIKVKDWSEDYLKSIDEKYLDYYENAGFEIVSHDVKDYAIVNADGYDYLSKSQEVVVSKTSPKDPDPIDPDPIDPDPIDPDPIDPDPIDPDPIDPDPVHPWPYPWIKPVWPNPNPWIKPVIPNPNPWIKPVWPTPNPWIKPFNPWCRPWKPWPCPIKPTPDDPDPIDPVIPDPDPIIPNPKPIPELGPVGSGSYEESGQSDPVTKIVYLIVVDDNIVFDENQRLLIIDFLDGVKAAKGSVEFKFVYESDLEKEMLIGIDSMITVSALSKEAKMADAVSLAIDFRGDSLKMLNLWFFDQPTHIDDGYENMKVDEVAGDFVHTTMFVNKLGLPGTLLTENLNLAGSQFASTGTVTLEALLAVFFS